MKNLIIFIDSGDTLVNESTEIRDANGDVVKADLIPGAKDALRGLHEAGYTIALVADGSVASFNNVYRQHGLSDCFDQRAISEAVGVSKPNAAMFETAMDLLHLTEADIPRIIMVGNNLSRDVLGANRMGITSVLMAWSPRYRHEPIYADERPVYTLASPSELPGLALQLEQKLQGAGLHHGTAAE